MKKSRKELNKFWKFHIEQWSESDLTQLEYCRQNALISYRFTYWKKKIQQQSCPPVEFVQIVQKSEAENTCSSGLKLNTGQGLQIEIPDGFSRETLEQVLMTLNVL